MSAFDAHRFGPFDGERECFYPEHAGLVELVGTCRIADQDCPVIGTTIYAHESGARARDYWRAVNARQGERGKLKSEVAA